MATCRFISLIILYQLAMLVAGRVTAEELDRRMGPGAKHLSCQVRVTGFHMKRYCRKHFNTPLRCDLSVHERQKVKKISKTCCEDASSCEPAMMFSEFCCETEDCGMGDCQPWDDALDELELANIVFASDEVFNSLKLQILERLNLGEKPGYLPEILMVYRKNPYLIPENEEIIKRYMKSHRLQTAHIAKSFGLIDENNQLAF